MPTINQATIVDVSQDPGLNYLSGSAVAIVQQRNANGLPTGNVIFNSVTEVRNVYVKQTTNVPGGNNDGELQFKNGNSFGGDPELKYNPNTNRLELDGSMVVGSIYADNFFFANNQSIVDVFSQGGGGSETNIDEYGNFYTSNFFASGAGLTGYGGAVFIRTSRPDANSTLDFEFNENGQFKLPPNGDIVDSDGNSVLNSTAGSQGIPGIDGTSFTFAGQWDYSHPGYNIGDVVKDDSNNLSIAVQFVPQSSVALNNTSFWQPFLQSGTNGTNGTNGQGVPTGGTTGQVLAKIDGTDYNTEWITATGGGDTGSITFNGDYIEGTDSTVRIRSLNRNETAYYNFAPGNGDYSTAVWDGTGITFNDPTQSIYNAIFALTDISTIEIVTVTGDSFTVTYGGSSTPGMPQAPTLFVNETAVDGPIFLEAVNITIVQGTESYMEISGTDFRVDVQDDIRMYANDVFRLINRASDASIEIQTNDGANSWEFQSDGTLILPSNGDILRNGTSVFTVNWFDVQNRPQGTAAVHDLIGSGSSADNGKFLKQDSIGTSTWAAVPAQAQYLWSVDGSELTKTLTTIDYNLFYFTPAVGYTTGNDYTLNLSAVIGAPGQRLVVIRNATLCNLAVTTGEASFSIADNVPAEFIYVDAVNGNNIGWVPLYGTTVIV